MNVRKNIAAAFTDIPSPAPAYTDIPGAATMLDVHPDTIRRMIWAGQLPSVKVRKVIRIPLDALTVDALNKGVK